MKKFIKDYYWLIAGVLVGVMSVALAYANLNLIIQDATSIEGGIVTGNTFSILGAVTIVAEYTIVIFLLSLGQKYFKNK